ncbi:MAG: hypothetical protein H0T84_11260 [Tatlockia sp.]|nr:hypothetical protein [Tatlockia sp.]
MYQNEIAYLTKSYEDKIHNYCIGEASLPHITVCQFTVLESLRNEIWENVCHSISDRKITLKLNKFSNITFDGLLYWLSLLPEHNCQLQINFRIISRFVKSLRKDDYDPHLTLFNYYPDKLDISEILKQQIEFVGEFELIIGESDESGQLNNIIL